jgi:hypothetical protein
VGLLTCERVQRHLHLKRPLVRGENAAFVVLSRNDDFEGFHSDPGSGSKPGMESDLGTESKSGLQAGSG